MSQKILNVLYQSDDNYAMVTGVSIVSMCENNQHLDEINFFISLMMASRRQTRRRLKAFAIGMGVLSYMWIPLRYEIS